MSTRDEILDRLRKNVRETYDMPDLSFKKRSFEDPVKAFIQTTITTAGAKLIESSTTTLPNSMTISMKKSTRHILKLKSSAVMSLA